MFSAFPLTKMRKAGIFMEPTGTFTYYEDLYGRRNEEEFDEGPIHSCESDDGDEAPEEPSQIRSASSLPVRQVRTPKAKSIQRGARSFGAIKAPGEFLSSQTSAVHAINLV